MRARLRSAFVLFLLCAGCGTLRNTTRIDPAGDGYLPLSDDEIRFARALAHYGQGLIYQDSYGLDSPPTSQDLTDAVRNFQAALELDPDTARLYPALAVAYLARKENDKAIEVLKKARNKQPGNVQPLIDLAVACEKSGRPDEAIAHFTQAIRMKPQMEGLYRELALIYFQQKKNPEALSLLRNALKQVDPQNSIVNFCYNFGKLYESVGMEDQALEFYRLAGTSKTVWPDPFIRIASIYMKNDMPKALKTIDRALEKMPDEPKLLFLMGLLYSNDRQFEKAIAAFQRTEKTVEKSGNKEEENRLNPVFYINYGSAYEKSGQFKNAEDVFRKCLKMYPDSHEVLNYLAYMWAEQDRNLDEGLLYVNKAISLSPDNGAYVDTLGWIYYKQKKYNQALEQIKKANEMTKNDATIVEHLGDIYFALQEKEKAISLWKQSFILDQSGKSVAAKLEQNGLNPGKILAEIESKLKRNNAKPSDRPGKGTR